MAKTTNYIGGMMSPENFGFLEFGNAISRLLTRTNFTNMVHMHI